MTIIISPIHDTFFTGRIWMGLDMRAIEAGFKKLGPGFETQVIDFSIISHDYSLIPHNAALFYTPSYNIEYNQFIKDVVLDIAQSRPDIILLPNLDQLFSFENKGYQELYKRRIGINKVFGKYYGDVDDFYKDNTRLSFPFVLKTLRGAMSSGVSLIQNDRDLGKFAKKNKVPTLKEWIKSRVREYLKKKKDKGLDSGSELKSVNYKKFFEKRLAFVTQEFLAGADCDYKVLVFADKYFVLRRGTRDNDFRASGSGKFHWVEPNPSILDFSMGIFNTMKVPFVSLDVVFTEQGYGLVEFQGIGFGPLTLTGSTYHFRHENGRWIKVSQKCNLEHEYVSAINSFLKQEPYENS